MRMAAKMHPEWGIMAANSAPSNDRAFQASTLETPRKVERRGRTRTGVHWPLTLYRLSSGCAIESTTINLSSEGFYCLATAGITVGERLIVFLRAPAHDPSGKQGAYVFKCDSRVIRTEPTAVEGCLGIACQIENYSVWRTGDASLESDMPGGVKSDDSTGETPS